VQSEDELQIVGQIGQERDLGRARIAEDRGHPELPHHRESGLTNVHLGDPSMPAVVESR
jgi:hypothetical protein